MDENADRSCRFLHESFDDFEALFDRSPYYTLWEPGNPDAKYIFWQTMTPKRKWTSNIVQRGSSSKTGKQKWHVGGRLEDVWIDWNKISRPEMEESVLNDLHRLSGYEKHAAEKFERTWTAFDAHGNSSTISKTTMMPLAIASRRRRVLRRQRRG